MLYRSVPKTGDSISILGFGAMRLPTKLGRIDAPRAERQIRHAVEQGVNYLDTAVPYHGGESEPFLGRLLSAGLRDQVRIATKLPPWDVRSPEDMELILNRQLQQLKTECIDYYLLHALGRKVWKKLERFQVLEFLDRAKRDGKIRYAGFSYHGDVKIFPEIVDSYDWDFCQLQYNYLDENTQAGTEGLNHAASKGMGIMVMEPLRGGDLATKIPARVNEIWQEAEISRTPAEWALRWAWNNPNVTCVLSGMNDEAHIDENLRIANEAAPESLTTEELALISRARDVYHELKKTGCTGCCYCMPCPHGVDIPRCFELFDDVYLFPENRWGRFRYPLQLGGLMAEPSHAALCTKCNKCLKKCPQSIQIPEMLEQVDRVMSPGWMRPVTWMIGQALSLSRWSNLRRAKSSMSDHEHHHHHPED